MTSYWTHMIDNNVYSKMSPMAVTTNYNDMFHSWQKYNLNSSPLVTFQQFLHTSGGCFVCLVFDFQAGLTAVWGMSLQIEVIDTLFSAASFNHWFRLAMIMKLRNVKGLGILKMKGNKSYEFSQELCSFFHWHSWLDCNSLHTSLSLQQESMHHVLKFDKFTLLAERTGAEW